MRWPGRSPVSESSSPRDVTSTRRSRRTTMSESAAVSARPGSSACSRGAGRRTRCGCSATEGRRCERAKDAIALARRRDTPIARRSRSPTRRCCISCGATSDRVGVARAPPSHCASGTGSHTTATGRRRPASAGRADRPSRPTASPSSSGPRASRRATCARTPAVLPVAAGRDARRAPETAIARPPTLDAAIAMAIDRSDVWWLPALYLQKGELEPPPATESRSLRQRAGNGAGAEKPRCSNNGFLARGITLRNVRANGSRTPALVGCLPQEDAYEASPVRRVRACPV